MRLFAMSCLTCPAKDDSPGTGPRFMPAIPSAQGVEPLAYVLACFSDPSAR
jgi:hypothetical protein